jgi:hypothetical protein
MISSQTVKIFLSSVDFVFLHKVEMELTSSSMLSKHANRLFFEDAGVQ